MSTVRKYTSRKDSSKRRRSPKKSVKKREKRSFFDAVMKVVAIIGAAMLALSYISQYINPSVVSFPLFFGLFFIPILIFNLVVLLIGVLRLRGYAFITLIAILPALFYVDLFYRGGAEEHAYGGNEFKLLTYNVGNFVLGVKGMPKDNAVMKVAEFIERENPDIVCLQEFIVKDSSLVKGFLKQFPYRYSYPPAEKHAWSGNMLLSRYPIIDAGALPVEKSYNLTIWADIRLKDSIVRVYNCHLQTNAISFASMAANMANKTKNISDEVKEVHSRIKGSNIIRAAQVNALVGHMKLSPYPSIVCGDFNDTPMSYSYRALKRGRKDSFAEGGKGFSASFTTFWPLLRIDYILVPEQYEVDRNVVSRVRYSDHYPVSTLFYIK